MNNLLCKLGVHNFLLVRWVRSEGEYRRAPTYNYAETVYKCSRCKKELK